MMPHIQYDAVITYSCFILGSARIPHPRRDELQTSNESRHIIVMSRNQMFVFDGLTEDNEVALNENDIAKNLQAILDNTATLSDTEVFLLLWGINETIVTHLFIIIGILV